MPSFLKVDVEGFECNVLSGARQILRARPKLLIEVHTKQLGLYGGSVKKLFELARLSDYQLWLQDDDSKSPREVMDIDPRRIRDRVHVFALPRK